jgi:anti-sigma regulatory factor (Ser/Thr protein kinase)
MPYYRCPSCDVTAYSAASHSSASLCPECLEELSVDARLDIVPGGSADVSRTVVSRPEAAAEARHALVGLALPQRTREDLALIVTELVTNSVLHAGLPPGDPIGVKVENRPDGVRLAVHDGGRGFEVPSRPPGATLVAGHRGLVIVDALAESWGIDCGADGCTVWCRIAIDEQPAAATPGVARSDDVRGLAVELARAAPAPI